jgi:hypothetical protein
MLRVHWKCSAEYLEPQYVDNLSEVPGPLRIMHFRQLLIVDQGFEVDTGTLLIAIVLDLARDIEERQVEFGESLVFVGHLQLSLVCEFKAFLQGVARVDCFLLSLGAYQLRHLFCSF